MSYSATTNMIVSNVLHPHDTSNIIQETTYSNASGTSSLIGHYELAFPGMLHNRIRISTSGTLVSRQDVIMTDNLSYVGQGRSINEALQIRLVVPNIAEVEASGVYSYTVSRFPMQGGNYSYPGLNWNFHWHQEFLEKWSADCNISQVYTSISGKSLQSTPALLSMSAQRDLFARNQATVSISVNDLFNSSTALSQNISQTGMTQTRSNLIGRYFLVGIMFKLEKFRQMKHQ